MIDKPPMLRALHDRLRRAVWQARERWSAPRFRPRYAALRSADAASPRFLFDPELADSAAARPWIENAVAEARSMTTQGLPVYALRRPPLTCDYPWSSTARERRRDVMIGARPHRFAFLPRLALAVVGGGMAPTQLEALLASWMRHATRHADVAFVSTFVVTQRVIAVTSALQFLGAPSIRSLPGLHACRDRLLQIAGEDIEYLLPRIGTSYPNGHLLTERFAAWFVARIYPSLVRGRVDASQAEAQWWSELERQTYADGGSFEHASHYHGLATELAVLALLLKRRHGEPVGADAERRVAAMLRFQADLCGADGVAFAFGDGVEDPMIPLDDGTRSSAAALREVYRALFDARLEPATTPAAERAFWMTNGARAPVPVVSGTDTHDRFYPLAGAFFFADAHARCFFRTGPSASQRCMVGHMHADLLSIGMVCQGHPVFVDPGTCTYRCDPHAQTDWRAYFAGPDAHNGVVLDGADPLGAVRGDFREGHAPVHATHRIAVAGRGLSLVEAELTASTASPYDGLTRGVIHVAGAYVVVYTLLGSTAPRGAILPLQLGANISVDAQAGRSFRVAFHGVTLCRLASSEGLSLEAVYAGNPSPPRGWLSPQYLDRIAAPQLRFSIDPARRLSAIVIATDPALGDLSIACDDFGRAVGFRIDSPLGRDTVLVDRDRSDPGNAVCEMGLEFDGRIVWTRESGGGGVALRALEVRHCALPAARIDLRFLADQKEVTIG